ncbi:MAG: relaxase/mobilization nuclease domain-containing protein [Parafannyhessea umbonata]|uniref:relaxase/mobilization nuclease domain-containing protein n=1 Tax=Parafannyhessea umbonata TaxID=604330 RepID=UPI0026EB24C3|nr:relaxase/mobilization nuclease domain-containing protein [Parafannyhessea umbonata]MCI6680818.1 relaxase/mobilization nuclease domain-containing protein [Parafannyhessea umbonata]
MPIVKPISGHTSCRGIYRYLTKNDRALASDYLNLDVPERIEGQPFDWAKVMDDTRRRNGNDRAWGGHRARTYKHYVLSPDPEDGIGLDALRELAVAWAERHFADYEVAIVYHDDNERGIPHAHVVVNNTNLATGNRLQDPDPKALKHSAQEMAQERHLRDLDTDMPQLDSRRPDRFRSAPTHQAVYRRRSEKAIEAEGGYSWVSDIRRRVGIARSVARSEREFRNVLSSIGVEVADNSPKAARRDWVYSFSDHPSWRITGENLGVAYGREAVTRRVSGSFGRLSDASERQIAKVARTAYELDDLEKLRALADAVEYVERNRIRDRRQLEESEAPTEGAELVRDAGILPEWSAPRVVRENKQQRQDREDRRSGKEQRSTQSRDRAEKREKGR